MSDTPHKPLPVKTIRLGTEMLDEVIDYVLLVRRKDKDGMEDVTVRTSSHEWAHGAMLQEIGFLDHMNTHWDCDGEKE